MRLTLKRQIVVMLSTCALLMAAVGSPAHARSWHKYENAYFEAYSDGSEKKVRKLLEELENFRAAVVQVMALEIPPGAAKTQVIMFRSARRFQKLTGTRYIAGFMSTVDGVPHIVMPVGRRNSESELLIRHEYIHALMAYSEHQFPRWFSEGVAEFMSGTRFTDHGTQFTLGGAISRPKLRGALVPWSELTSKEFNVHSLKRVEKASNAYFQAWLLTHYLIVGDQAKHYPKLSAYLGRYAAGESSASAFQAEFGMSADELGEIVMHKYRRKLSYYKLRFRPGTQDHDFVRHEANAETVENTIDSVKWR